VGGTETELLLELSLSAVPASCARARREIRAALDGMRVNMAAVELAASEAVTNAIVHAYRDQDGAGADECVTIRLTTDAGGVWILVADEGVGMSPRDDSPGLGLGLSVIAHLTDQLLVVQAETGTRVHMRFGFNGDHADAA
jgi:serine/threonine-protein kinase RsbW